MAALRYFLHQDDLKAGDTGSAAQLEAQKEEEEHIKLVQVALSMKNECIVREYGRCSRKNKHPRFPAQ